MLLRTWKGKAMSDAASERAEVFELPRECLPDGASGAECDDRLADGHEEPEADRIARDAGGRFADSDAAAEAARRGRRKEGARREALEELADLPELRDVESAKAILGRLVDLTVSGVLTGSKVLGATRAIEVFLKTLDSEQDRTTLAETRALLLALKRETRLRRTAG
jgi:hypothetical protein